MITTSTHPTGTRPRRSTLDRSTALRLAATEYQRYLELLLTLETTDWTQPTDCAAWNVRQMAAHNLGMAEMAGSLPEMGRQFSGAGRRPVVRPGRGQRPARAAGRRSCPVHGTPRRPDPLS